MSAYETLQNIRSAQANIADLQKVLKVMDPASGVAISIRRGIARDNHDDEHDREKRPWVTVEVSNLDLAKVAIEAAILAAKESETHWTRAANRDLRELTDFLDTLVTGGAK